MRKDEITVENLIERYSEYYRQCLAIAFECRISTGGYLLDVKVNPIGEEIPPYNLKQLILLDLENKPLSVAEKDKGKQTKQGLLVFYKELLEQIINDMESATIQLKNGICLTLTPCGYFLSSIENNQEVKLTTNPLSTKEYWQLPQKGIQREEMNALMQMPVSSKNIPIYLGPDKLFFDKESLDFIVPYSNNIRHRRPMDIPLDYLNGNTKIATNSSEQALLGTKKYLLKQDLFDSPNFIEMRGIDNQTIYLKQIRLKEQFRKPGALNGYDLRFINWEHVVIGEDEMQQGIDFTGAKNVDFNLMRNPIYGNNLKGANLTGCHFRFDQLPEKMILRGTILKGTDLFYLTEDQARACIYDESVKIQPRQLFKTK